MCRSENWKASLHVFLSSQNCVLSTRYILRTAFRRNSCPPESAFVCSARLVMHLPRTDKTSDVCSDWLLSRP